jgi:hypothetical protein
MGERTSVEVVGVDDNGLSHLTTSYLEKFDCRKEHTHEPKGSELNSTQLESFVQQVLPQLFAW